MEEDIQTLCLQDWGYQELDRLGNLKDGYVWYPHMALEADHYSMISKNSLPRSGGEVDPTLQNSNKRAITASRSISQITTKFFNTSDVHASKLNQIVDESQKSNDHKLTELGNLRIAAEEERQLFEKVKTGCLQTQMLGKHCFIQCSDNQIVDSTVFINIYIHIVACQLYPKGSMTIKRFRGLTTPLNYKERCLQCKIPLLVLKLSGQLSWERPNHTLSREA
ncbi:hypothetical protein Leryth_002882 [Lithospermum erythrorhizon]|nr:hypothetical protein Leryth_002882 [Lithospermum erythrorhizon]